MLTKKPSPATAESIIAHGRQVVALEANGLKLLEDSLGDAFVRACAILLNCNGRAVVSGLGKSGHVATKMAATLASTGTPSFFVHAAEAAHGDMGVFAREDVAILISNSGETPELQPIIRHVARLGVPLVGISSRAESTLMRAADVPLVLPDAPEACPVGIAPTTSTTMMLALGDALAMVVMHERGFSRDDFQTLHPGGLIGLRLMQVDEIMHRGERMPLVTPDMAMSDVIVTMSSKSFGIAGVIDDGGKLVGVITDGDLRRHVGQLATARAHEVMTRQPKAIAPSTRAEDALKFLNTQKVTALFVTDDRPDGATVPIGIVSVHDFLRLGLN